MPIFRRRFPSTSVRQRSTLMKLAVVTATPELVDPPAVSLLAGPFSERLRKAAECGFTAVELISTNPESLDVAQIATQIADHGLSTCALGTGALAGIRGLRLVSGDSGIEYQAMESAKAMLDMAAAIGAPIVTIGSFRGSVISGTPDGSHRLAESLSVLCDRAASRGLRLAIEPLNRYEADYLNTAMECVAFIQEHALPHAGVLIDTFHMNIEEAAVNRLAHPVAALLVHVHIGDSNRLHPGAGHFNFRGFLAELQRVGYSGFLSAELLAQPDPDTAARKTAEHMLAWAAEPIVPPGVHASSQSVRRACDKEQ